MRVTWTHYPDLPEEFWADFKGGFPLGQQFSGELLKVTDSFFGGLKAVVMLDEGRIVHVDAGLVRREDACSQG